MENEQKIWLLNRPVKVEFLVKPYIVEKALNNTRRFSHFHPSAWGSCLRKIAYQYYNDQEPFLERSGFDVDDRFERIFDNGHSVHARWQKYLDHAGVLRGCWNCKKCKKVFGSREPLGVFNPSASKDWQCDCGSRERLEYAETLLKSEKEYNFEGHCDAIIDVRETKFKQNNEYDIYIVDFKSMKDEYYSELTEPKIEHVIQVNIYMWILNLKGALVVYENKDSQHLKEMFVPRDDDLIEKIKAQSIWMQDILKQKRLPHRPNGFTKSKFPCRFCEFVDVCFNTQTPTNI
jgi:CRISPR/Cas system-associated exonuclease Cas4 (RecB family)